MTGKSLDRMTVNELKAELKNRDLAVTVGLCTLAKLHSPLDLGLQANADVIRRPYA